MNWVHGGIKQEDFRWCTSRLQKKLDVEVQTKLVRPEVDAMDAVMKETNELVRSLYLRHGNIRQG